MQKNNNENRYGNLLDEYMDGGNKKKSYSPMLNKEISKHKDEGKDKYGDLLKNAVPNYKIYDDMLNVDNVFKRRRQNEEEAKRQNQARRQERIEREQRELQEHIDRNNALINDMLEKKRAEQEAARQKAEKKKKEEAEKANFYKNVERLSNIDPHMAEVYIKARAKF